MNRQIFRLAIPSIVAGITIPLVGMTDTAIAGRLGSAAAIGGIAIGSMLFDLLYWNFGFLRISTAGLTAQAYGRGDFAEAVRTGTQSLLTAWGISILVLLIQWPFANLILWLTPSSPQVESFARTYFHIRIWAAPAVLPLFALRGWFIGMQNTLASMVMDVVINVSNVVLSIYLSLYRGMGVSGIAWGTLIAQYTGLLVGFLLLGLSFGKYKKYLQLKGVLQWSQIKRFFSLSGNLFIRSGCMLLIYNGFTFFAADYGDTLLAVATIMMKLLLLYSYILDGFAYAGEALVGKYIGARNREALRVAVRQLFFWGFWVGVFSTLAYVLCDQGLLRLMTSTQEVIEAAQPFLVWLYFMPLISCLTFTWDGIYIGATAGVALRNTMLLSVAAFYLCYFAFRHALGIQSLWIGYAAHLVTRSLAQSFMAGKHVFGRIE